MPITDAITPKDFKDAKSKGFDRLALTFKKLMMDQGISPADIEGTPRGLQVLPEDVWTLATMLDNYAGVEGGTKVYISRNVEFVSPHNPSWWVVSLPDRKVMNVGENLVLEIVRVARKDRQAMIAGPKTALVLDKLLKAQVRKLKVAHRAMEERVATMHRTLPRKEGWEFRRWASESTKFDAPKSSGEIQIDRGDEFAINRVTDQFALAKDEDRTLIQYKPETIKLMVKRSKPIQ